MLEPASATAAWNLDIVAVRDGSHGSGERSALSRDVARGRRLRLGAGAYVAAGRFEALTPEAQHLVRMRALALTAPRAPVFSHWSAAVLHGLPGLRSRLVKAHVVVADPDLRRSGAATAHVLRLAEAEVVDVAGLLVTARARTVVDLADGGSFEEGVMAADGALVARVPRAELQAAVEAAGARRAARRIDDVVAFAHPGAESALESRQRCTMFRLGLEIPELQHRLALGVGVAFLDALLPGSRVGVEADGEAKYLDPRMAPRGAARAVLEEKRREDAVRAQLAGLVRPGWTQAGSTAVLGRMLARAGALPLGRRPTIADHAAVARSARPRPRP